MRKQLHPGSAQPLHCKAQYRFPKLTGVAKSTFTMEKVLWEVTPTLPAFCPVGHPCCRGLGLLTAGKVSGALCWEQLWHTQPWGQES